MKKSFYLIAVLLFTFSISKAQQTTAQDFNMTDCATGNMHHLFATLDSNEVVIMEFFMTCASCVTAGQKIENMLTTLNPQYPGKINWWQLAYTNSYSCTTINDWVSTNSFTSVPFDSGAADVAYYGGFGMPTVVVVAGANHDVIFTDIGWVTSDTTAISSAIHNFFSALAGTNEVSELNSFNVYPNPSSENVIVELNISSASKVQLGLYDLSGKNLPEIFNGNVNEGQLSKTFSVAEFANGIYFLKATINEKSFYTKINVIK